LGLTLSIPYDNDGDRTTPDHIVTCAMPSPDAIAAAAAAGGLSLDNPGGTSGNAGFSASEAAASIGLRTQSIQLLRDAMYRMCEGYAAGGIDSVEYGVMMRRFQSSMVAILAIEQLTGAVTAQQGAVSAGVDNTAVQNALEAVRTAENEEAKALTNLNGATDTNRQALQNEYNNRRIATQNAHARLSAAVMGSTHAASALNPRQGRDLDPQAAAAVAQTVESITLAAMSSDYNSHICFEVGRLGGLEENTLATSTNQLRSRLISSGIPEAEANDLVIQNIRNESAFATYCANLLTRDVNNRWDSSEAIERAINRLIPERGPIPAENLAALRALLAQLDQGWTSSDLRTFPTVTTPPPQR
jgi:hypothetical protein